MRSFELRSAFLLVVTLGLSACPGDDTGDEGAGTVATTTESAETDPGTTTSEGSTTVELTGTTLKLPTQVGGYRETVNGREYAVDLTPVMLVQSTSSLSTSPQA